MFYSISNEYDLINSIITFNSHKRWKREILKIAKKVNPKNSLDIATGTADIAIQLGTLTNCKVIGIDISKKMLDIGRQKIKKNKLDHCIFLKTGDAEILDYEDNFFDFVVSTDTFEHVQNLKITMDECYRVLKPGGSLLAVFPQFLQPFESHLNFVTNLPCIHWFFNSDKVSKNYYEILKERGDSAKWYNGEKFNLEEWEKLPTLNGTSIRKFEKILEKNNWSNVKWVKRPILTDGRRSKKIFFKSLSFLFYQLVFIKYLDELFMGRICVICKK